MKQKLIVRAVAMALALPIGAAWAAPTDRVKPDSMLAVDMNRIAVINGIVANWKSQLSAVQEKVLRDTLSTMRADRLMAASMAPSFEGLLSVMNTTDHVLKSEKVTLKALSNEVVYVPITPCRIVDTRVTGGPISAGNEAKFFFYSDTGADSWSTEHRPGPSQRGRRGVAALVRRPC